MSEAEVEDEALPFCWVDMAVGSVKWTNKRRKVVGIKLLIEQIVDPSQCLAHY
ncbi:hypothetical protein PILCRDRAFT_812328 [Piloderma croceum F 1598]|uniref:Uncharacterized protein n=1 Tax=Piloderma croceum (strain F 1598) TaxID=765440 RepID=A0A0C3GFX5_PILCF|nr:hypothetical protein PILCRDRAFT_812328 [Piloderma croceum F 1598]